MDSNMSPAPFQLFRPLPPAIGSALRASIERFGVLVPVVRDQHGNVLDGHQRVRIADELGLKYPVNVIEVADEAEALEIARTLNEDRRAMPKVERLPVEVALREEGHSLRAIAGVVGVDEKQVRRDLSGADMSAPETTRGLDGKSYPARRIRSACGLCRVTHDPDSKHKETPRGERRRGRGRTGKAVRRAPA